MKYPFKKYISLLICTALTLGVLSPFALAEDTASPKEINLENIYDIAYAGNVDSKIADFRLKQLNDAIEDMQEALKSARELAKSDDPTVSEYGVDLLISLFPKQISDETKKSTQLSVELSKRRAGLGGQALLAAYYSAGMRHASLKAASEKLSRTRDMTSAMQKIGMATEDKVSAAAASLGKVQASLSEIEYTVFELKSQLSFYTGIDEASLAISPFTGTSSAKAYEVLSAINYDEDLKKAQENNLAIKIQALIAKDSTGAQRGIEELKLGSLKTQLPAALKKTYSVLKSKAESLDYSENVYALSKKNADMASLKFTLGMISRKSYEDALSQLAEDENALKLAQLDFITSLYTYNAMVNGVWQ